MWDRLYNLRNRRMLPLIFNKHSKYWSSQDLWHYCHVYDVNIKIKSIQLMLKLDFKTSQKHFVPVFTIYIDNKHLCIEVYIIISNANFFFFCEIPDVKTFMVLKARLNIVLLLTYIDNRVNIGWSGAGVNRSEKIHWFWFTQAKRILKQRSMFIEYLYWIGIAINRTWNQVPNPNSKDVWCMLLNRHRDS